jgi:hypothetical protein
VVSMTIYFGYVYELGYKIYLKLQMIRYRIGARGNVVLKALFYKSEGRGLETR